MSNKLELTGKKFNNLTVIKESKKRTKGGAVNWICQCDCGTIKKLEASYIKRGRIKSCGCQQGPKKLPFGESALNGLIGNMKAGARSRDLEFKLTKEEIVSLINKNCYYCNTKPSNKYVHGHGYGYYIYNGIDRVNNLLGYTRENSVTCCKQCNYMKHKMSFSEFLNKVRAIYEYRLKEE